MKPVIVSLIVLGGLAALGATAVQQIVITDAGRKLIAAEDAAAERTVLELGRTVAAYSNGSAPLTDQATALDFVSGPDPVVNLDEPGRWRISAAVMMDPTQFGSYAETVFKLRRTNNTATDITNAVVAFPWDGQELAVLLPPVVYDTTNSNDVIALFGSNADNSGGVRNAWIVAERVR